MATVTFKGNPVKTAGALPAAGKPAPAFTLAGGDLSDVTLASFKGKKVVLNIVPSLDTPVCALSAQRFNREATSLANTVVVNVSADLPFAQKRFCDAGHLAAVTNLSAFRAPAFGKDYGVGIVEGPLAGLLTRAVVVVDATGRVAYAELVPEITQEPNYDAALAAVKALA